MKTDSQKKGGGEQTKKDLIHEVFIPHFCFERFENGRHPPNNASLPKKLSMSKKMIAATESSLCVPNLSDPKNKSLQKTIYT